MSFGFGVGDFIAAIELANKIRKEFVDTPGQFKAISDEVRSLSIVLQDADVSIPNQELSEDQKRDLEAIDGGCRIVLAELQQMLDNYSELNDSKTGSVTNKIKRVWKRVKWEPKDVMELRIRISTNISLLNAFNGRLTRDNVAILVHHQQDKERKDILEWITKIDYAPQQNDFIARRQEGTGLWLLNSEQFQTWLGAEQQTLFCPGIPGAGKTIITSIVVEELHTRFRGDTSIGIAYLYCNFRRRDEQQIADMLCSLVRRLAATQASIPESVKTLHDLHRPLESRPPIDVVSRTLRSVVATYSKVFIIIDALDECDNSQGGRIALLSELLGLQETYMVNLFTTSRFIPEIAERLQGSISLEIRASDHDVMRYLDSQIFRLPSFIQHNASLQENVKSEILEAVDGMFLLAQLHLDSLAGKRSPKALKAALKRLPSGSDAYDNAYEDAMVRIEAQITDQKDLAKEALSWITGATRPLTTRELQHALAVEEQSSSLDEDNFTDVDDMVSVCAGLVAIDEESQIIRLVHYTTQEYFERRHNYWFPSAETNIAKTCLTYLSFEYFESGNTLWPNDLRERLKAYALFDYASQNWAHYVSKASEPDQAFEQAALSFLESVPKIEASQVISGFKLTLPWKGMTGLHLAVYFGADAAVQILLKHGADIDLEDARGRTPLSLAVAGGTGGKLSTAKLLLDDGASTAKNAADCNRTPPLRATDSANVDIIKLLVSHGADLERKDYQGLTPLALASKEGYLKIVNLLLLDRKADLEARRRGSDSAVFSCREWAH